MTDKKPTTLYHPTLRDAKVEVDASKVSDWTDQGWRKTQPDRDEKSAE